MSFATASLILGAVGTAVSYYGQTKEADARKQAESAREKQQTLLAQRQRRKALRQSIIANSTARFNATAQGADSGSALPGAFGQIAGETGRQIQSINQNEELGSEIFDANRNFYDASKTTSAGAGLGRLAAASERLASSGAGNRVIDYIKGTNG